MCRKVLVLPQTHNQKADRCRRCCSPVQSTFSCSGADDKPTPGVKVQCKYKSPNTHVGFNFLSTSRSRYWRCAPHLLMKCFLPWSYIWIDGIMLHSCSKRESTIDTNRSCHFQKYSWSVGQRWIRRGSISWAAPNTGFSRGNQDIRKQLNMLYKLTTFNPRWPLE